MRVAALLLCTLLCVQAGFAAAPVPSQPILVVNDSASSDPYQYFVPELLSTEGVNEFQVAQLADLSSSYLTNFDVVLLPHVSLTAAQVSMLQGYVTGGGLLIGLRADPHHRRGSWR